jgi:hypothetical protein
VPQTNKTANPVRISGLRNSRGGTRTRDPGIMRTDPPAADPDSLYENEA